MRVDVCVIGGHGTVGRAIVSKLTTQQEVVAVKSRQPEQDLRCKTLVFCHGGRDSEAQYLQTINDYLSVTEAKTVVLISSQTVYGNQTGVVRDGDSPDPQTPYAVSRLRAEQTVAKYAGAKGAKVSVVRAGNVFSPQGIPSGTVGVVQALAENAVKRGFVVMSRNPLARANLLASDDLAQLVGILLSDQTSQPLTVNASALAMSASELVKMAGEELKCPVVTEDINVSVLFQLQCPRATTLGWHPIHTSELSIRAAFRAHASNYRLTQS